jgi:hypothetical protein
MAGSQLTRLPVLNSCEKRLPVGFVEIGVEGCRLRKRAGRTRSLRLSRDPHGCGTDICFATMGVLVRSSTGASKFA